MLSDEEIIKDLAEKIESIRISRHMKESDMVESAGFSRKTFYNFKKGQTSFSLKNFIRLLRTLDNLDSLQTLFPEKDSYSPLAQKNVSAKKRVRDKQSPHRDFQWGDER